MIEIELPTPGVTPTPVWAPMLNTAIETIAGAANPNVILGLGTSITAGTVTDGVSWVDYLPDVLESFDMEGPFTVINAGVSGDPTGNMLTRLKTILEGRQDIGVAVIEVAVNDFSITAWNYPAGRTIGNMMRMIGLCHSRGVRPIIVGTAPFNASAWDMLDIPRITNVAKTLSSMCDRAGVTYVDLWTKLRGSGAWTDGLHPDLDGQKAWATAIGAAIAGYTGSTVMDDFDRGYSTTLDNSTSGSRWIVSAPGFGTSDEGHAFCNSTSSNIYAVIPVGFTNQEVTVTIISADGAGIALRADFTLGVYSYILNAETGKVYKVISGTITEIGDTEVFEDGDYCRFGVSGTTLYVQRNGGTVHTITDSSISGGLYAGLYHSSTSTDTRWDDILVSEA